MLQDQSKEYELPNFQIKTPSIKYNFVIFLSAVSLIENFDMERCSAQQRAEIAKLYFQNFSSIILTQRAFRRAHSGNRRARHGQTIRHLANAFLESDTVRDTGRPGEY